MRATILSVGLACLAPLAWAATPLTVAVVVHQENADSRWVDGLLQQALLEQGYRVVSVGYREWLALRDTAFAQEVSGRRAAVAERWRLRAQVVVFGAATVSSSLPDAEGLALRSAHLVVEAYQTDTGELLGTYSARAKRAHVDEATGGNQALERCVQEVLPRLLGDLEKIKVGSESSGAAQRTLIRLRVLGVHSTGEADSLLKKLTGVRSVRAARIEGFALNVANYELRASADARALGQQLQDIRLGSLKLEILEITSQTLRARLTPK